MKVVEQKKFLAKGDDSEFGNLNVKKDVPEPPPELLIYNLCQLFHCLPSEIAEEDYEEISKIVTIHNALAEVEEMRQEWEKKNLSVDLGISLEIEKLKRDLA